MRLLGRKDPDPSRQEDGHPVFNVDLELARLTRMDVHDYVTSIFETKVRGQNMIELSKDDLQLVVDLLPAPEPLLQEAIAWLSRSEPDVYKEVFYQWEGEPNLSKPE